jgi:hypothetical protein
MCYRLPSRFATSSALNLPPAYQHPNTTKRGTLDNLTLAQLPRKLKLNMKGEREKNPNQRNTKNGQNCPKYKLTFTAMKLSPHLKPLLPAWYRPGTARRPMNNTVTTCLIQNHQVKTIADTLWMSARLTNPMYPHPHKRNQWCLCRDCVLDRTRIGCKDPNKCEIEALEIICDLPQNTVP